MMKSLKSKIEDKTAKICIVGLGYVGFPLATEFAKRGFKVTGFDTSREKVEVLKNEIRAGALSENFKVTADPDIAYKNVNFIIICVPTPITKTKEPDLKYIISAAEGISRRLRKGMFVILESTTYPGTTEEVLIPILERSGLKAGFDFGVAYSPERIDPGNKKYTIENTPKIVSGVTGECTDIAAQLYAQITKPVKVSSLKVAEATKIVENVFRAVNIALVNELGLIFERMRIDTWEVIEAASTKPFGFMPFYPGAGVGGHCIPVDPFYLSWKAKEVGLTTKFIELAGEINQSMPNHVINLVIRGLNDVGKSVKGSKIFILGMAYKKDVDDTRNSPMVIVAEKLDELGAKVKFNDDYVKQISLNNEVLLSSPLEDISHCDCLIVGVNHSYYDEKEILSMLKESSVVVDCVNIFDKSEVKGQYVKVGGAYCRKTSNRLSVVD